MACTYIALSLVCVELLYGISIAEEPTCWCTLGQRCNNSTRFHRSMAKENVALGKESKISSLKKIINEEYEDPLLEACLANNGNVGTKYIPSSRNKIHPNCIQTDLADLSPSWQVDIGRSYTITSITVYADQESARFLQNITITVNDELCFTFESNVTYGVQNDIRCRTPILGRIVRLFKPKYTGRKPDFFDEYIIAVCEVQVWVCKSDHYGEECDQKCEPACKSGCERYYGYCIDGCKVGYYGHFCSEKCSDNCLNGTCQHFGICTHGCKPNWKGKTCDEARTVSVAEGGVENHLLSIYIVVAVSGISCMALLILTVCIRKRLLDNISENLGKTAPTQAGSKLSYEEGYDADESSSSSSSSGDEDEDEEDDTSSQKSRSSSRRKKVIKSVVINEIPQDSKAPSVKLFPFRVGAVEEDNTGSQKSTTSSRELRLEKTVGNNETPQESKEPSEKSFTVSVKSDEEDSTTFQKSTTTSPGKQVVKTVGINETPQKSKAPFEKSSPVSKGTASGIGVQKVGSSSAKERKK